MPGLFLAGFDVHDENAVVLKDEEVRLAGEGGGVSAEAECVLRLDADVVSALEPLVAVLVEQLGMAGEPVGLVAVGRLTGPRLVMGGFDAV